MISITQLDNAEITRLGEIDRSEHVTLSYRYQDGKLIPETVDWEVPRWFDADSGDHSVTAQIRQWTPVLEAGGVLLGALDGDLLVGVGILRYQLSETMAQLAFLHVSKDYRRQGIARRLAEEMIRLAREDGATEMYVSATPSGSAVGFYRSLGFEVAPPERIHPELFALEPEDIHMIRVL